MAARNTKRPKKSAANNDAQTIPHPGTERDSQQPAASETHQAVNCSICWEELPTVAQPRRSRKWVARPEGCDHHFCYTCLKRWTRTKTSCPVCRTRFARIAIMRTVSGEVMRTDEFSNAETSASEDSEMLSFFDNDFAMGESAQNMFMSFLPMPSFSSWFFRTQSRDGAMMIGSDSDSDDTDWSTSHAHHRPDSDSEIESDSATDSFLRSDSDSFTSSSDSDSDNTINSSDDSDSDSDSQRAGRTNLHRSNRDRDTYSAFRRNATEFRDRTRIENRQRSRETQRGLRSALLHAFAQGRADAAAANAHLMQPARQRQRQRQRVRLPRSILEREQRRQHSLSELLSERVRRTTTDPLLSPTASNSATVTSSNALPEAPVTVSAESNATTNTGASAATSGGRIELVNVTLNVPLGQTTSHGTQRGTSTFTLPGGRGSAEMRVDLRFEPRPGGVFVHLSGNAFVPDVHTNTSAEDNARPSTNSRRVRNRAASNASVNLNAITIPLPVPLPVPVPTTASSSATNSAAVRRRPQRTLPNHQHATRKNRTNMQDADVSADRPRSPLIRERFELANRFRRARARVANEPRDDPTEAASTPNTAPHRG